MSSLKMLLKMNFPGYFSRSLKKLCFGENSLPFFIYAASGDLKGLNPSVISTFEKRVGLRLEVEEMGQGNVCFANREEVMPEFRTVFNLQELLEYIFAQLPGEEAQSENILPYPADAENFWELVQSGRQKKQRHYE